MSPDNYDGPGPWEYPGGTMVRITIHEPSRSDLRRQRTTPEKEETLRKKRADASKAKQQKWRDKNPDYGKDYMKKRRADAKAKKKKADP